MDTMQLESERAFAAVDVPAELAYDRTGPGTPAGRYLRQFWIPVAEIADVKPARAKTITIMSEKFTLYRGESGATHLIGHLCPHRHVALAVGRVEGECLRCFYHGWKFDHEGACVDQPAEDESFKEKVRVAAFPTREYLGLVFAFLGTGEPPPFPEFKRFERPGELINSNYVRHTNYFNTLENGADHVHANFVHERSAFSTVGVNREIPEIEPWETDFGIAFNTKYKDGKNGRHYVVMPISAFIMIAEEGLDKLVDHLAFRVPIDDRSHRSFIVNLFEIFGEERDRFFEKRRLQRQALQSLPPREEIVQAVIRGEMHIDEVPDRPDLVGIQDSVVMETQAGVSEREPDQLGRSDRAAILLRRIYAREIEAFAQGKPVKRWTYPEDLSPISAV
jgi:5,5'-dehydrodivanillate O-demethylase oxygenase subunit